MHSPDNRTWVEVDLEAIAHNLDLIRQLHPDAALMPVIKAEAYGHGLIPVARRLDRDGIRFFGVANVGEARRLHLAGVRTCPFILGPCMPDERAEIVEHEWGCTLSNLSTMLHLEQLAAAAGKQIHAHLALDTGMGREGFLPEELDELMSASAGLEHLIIDGVMTHCPCADEDLAFTLEQIELYGQCVQRLRQVFDLKYIHLSASAALLGYDIPFANLVRPGLLLYGIAPLASVLDGVLQPALKLCAKISLIRELPAGHGVSYGRTHILEKPSLIATLGIGYADGWMRALSGTPARAYIEGKAYPIIGRVTMDQMMLDITGSEGIEEGQCVELICPEQSAVTLAEYAHTIPWEILTSIGPRVPRSYLR